MAIGNSLQRLYKGDFNTMTQEWQPDGSVIITLSKHYEPISYRFSVRDLYGQHEEVLSYQELDTFPPPFILERMKQAQEASHHGESET